MSLRTSKTVFLENKEHLIFLTMAIAGHSARPTEGIQWWLNEEMIREEGKVALQCHQVNSQSRVMVIKAHFIGKTWTRSFADVTPSH